jgi:hypothetical protein
MGELDESGFQSNCAVSSTCLTEAFITRKNSFQFLIYLFALNLIFNANEGVNPTIF